MSVPASGLIWHVLGRQCLGSNLQNHHGKYMDIRLVIVSTPEIGLRSEPQHGSFHLLMHQLTLSVLDAPFPSPFSSPLLHSIKNSSECPRNAYPGE